jgi:methionyl-tRNA formyltransferase
MRRRLLYFGLPLGALCLARDGLELVAACISRPDQPGMRRVRRLPGTLVLERPDLRDPSVHERLRACSPDFIASWFWTKAIPQSVIEVAPFAFNVHPSLLPRHRGPDPYFWALALGDRETGVTAHRLTARYDEGPIIARRLVPVPPDVDAWRLARVLDRPSLALLREVATRYAKGEELPASPQDANLVTWAPEPDDDACELRFHWPVSRLLARIRAASPWPGAFTEYRDRTIVVLRADAVSKPAGLVVGEAARVEGSVVIAAADGGLRVLAARREEDTHVLVGSQLAALFPGLPALS